MCDEISDSCRSYVNEVFSHIRPGGASSGVEVSCLISLYALQFVKVKIKKVFFLGQKKE